MKIIKDIKSLEENRVYLDSLFRSDGKIYFHSPHSMEATFMQYHDKDCVIVIDTENNIVTGFYKKKENIWQCTFNGFGLLASNDISAKKITKFIQELQQKLNASTLYFPLIYKIDVNTAKLSQVEGFHFHPRLPSPIISGNLNSDFIWERVWSRYGSRAEKQKTLFENRFTTIKLSGVNVSDMLTAVELTSWKRIYKQDMLSRDNQLEYYNKIIETGLAQVTFALGEDQLPIAFRIDALTNGILYAIKWSYNEKYKKYSPGFYLLTVNLFQQYTNSDIEYIDLYGSPDSLKQLLETDRLERVDYYISNNFEEVSKLISNRSLYDAKIANNYAKNQGVKSMFNIKP